MTEPDGEFLREQGAARTRAADRGGAADELMRLADDPLLLGSLLRRGEGSRVWSPEVTKVPLLGLALLSSNRKGSVCRNGYQKTETLRAPSLTPEAFDPTGEDWVKTLDLHPPAEHPSSAASSEGRWGMAAIIAILVLGILLLLS